jgi:DNA-binding GntR family transcriptional regulator
MNRTNLSPSISPKSSTAGMSSPERVAAELTSALQRRELAIGQRLVEADLTAKLGVGRSTIREAFKILASNGVVEIVPFRGAVIRELTLDDARNLLAVLEALTGLAARLAAGKIDVGRNRSAFKAVAAPLIEPRPAEELERILDERARFYQTIFDIADNPELNRAMPTWRAHLFRTQFYPFLTKQDLRAMVSEYRQISEAILDGDAARAESATRKHLIKSGERSLPHLR